MTVKELAQKPGAEIVTGNDSLEREVKSGYACDLLSLVMGRGPADSAWMTVMGNVNAVAVASLADIACIIVCEGCEVDSQAIQKATAQDIAILKTNMNIYDACVAVSKLI